MGSQEDKLSDIEQDHLGRPEEVLQSDEKDKWSRQERSGSRVTRRYRNTMSARTEFLRSTAFAGLP
jgi:hypothetical protein